MAGINDREKAFENKYAHDEEMKFKMLARRNKLLGQWAAEKMGKADVDAYATEVVIADLEEAGDEDVFRKVRGDFDSSGVTISDGDIREKMVSLLSEAEEQLKS